MKPEDSILDTINPEPFFQTSIRPGRIMLDEPCSVAGKPGCTLSSNQVVHLDARVC